jgi:hypothetical protein
MLKCFFIALFIGFVAAATDYCDSKLCPGGAKHIACGNSGNFASSCPPDRQLVSLSKSDIQLFLKSHNKLRNKIASGQEAGFNPAVRMATMVRPSSFTVEFQTIFFADME